MSASGAEIAGNLLTGSYGSYFTHITGGQIQVGFAESGNSFTTGGVIKTEQVTGLKQFTVTTRSSKDILQISPLNTGQRITMNVKKKDNYSHDRYFSIDVFANDGVAVGASLFVPYLYATTLTISGTKKRVVNTTDYGKRSLYCYEMASPMFGDVGDGVIGGDGLCYIQIDPVLSEAIATTQYQVFVQAFGNRNQCYVLQKKSTYFVVAGEPGTEFSWELKAKQFDYANTRLDMDGLEGVAPTKQQNYGELFETHLNDIANERIGNVA